MLKAFEAINRILTQKKDWKELERAFRKMLHRVTGKGDRALEFNLWHNLGVIYRDRLKQLRERGRGVRDGVASLQPENVQEHVILAEIYGARPERIKDAVAEHQILLQARPVPRGLVPAALQALLRRARVRQARGAWPRRCNFLKKADAEHAQFYEQYKPRGADPPASRA